ADSLYEHAVRFVYQTTGPNPMRMIFLATDTGLTMFSVECGTGIPYQTNWIKLPFGFGDHRRWIAGAKAACPQAGIAASDFTGFRVDVQGRMATSFGMYSSEPKSASKMHYNVNIDGTVGVKLGCKDGGDTGFKKYKLVGMGIGKPYKLSAMKDGDTWADLNSRLKVVCPDQWRRLFSGGEDQTVRFATSYEIYIVSANSVDRLRRASS
ncbi:hypothetical protein FOZ63_000629, partial [Perkinsus olseni]